MSDTRELPPAATLSIAVVYALPEQQIVVDLQLPENATVQLAVERSQLPRRFPGITQQPLHCAIFGRVVALSTTLRDGDRVEILRMLLLDPKESRRQAALEQRKRG